MFAGDLLENIRFIQAIEQNWVEALVLKDLGLVFASYKHRDGILGEVELRLK